MSIPILTQTEKFCLNFSLIGSGHVVDYVTSRPSPKFNSVTRLSRYTDPLRAGRSGVRTSLGAIMSVPVQNGPKAYPALCTMGTGSHC